MTEPYDGVELFAGAGGVSVALARCGLNVLGIENDRWACETRRAAGHPTLEADVLTVNPLDYAGIRVLAGSPPCQTFSMAGKGSGRAQLDLMLRAVVRLGRGEWPAEEIEATHDPRTLLVLEPLRWALLIRPQVIVLEQVPAVLPVWEAMACVLREQGYSTACAILHAEMFGVPQTRKRAFLTARLDGIARMPAPTHTRYRKGKPRQEPGLLPWVSMADALGWGATERPVPTVTSGGTDTGGAEPIGNGGRKAMERERGLWLDRESGSRESSDLRPDDDAESDCRAGREELAGPTRAWRVRSSMGTPKVDGRNGSHEFDPAARPAHTVTGKVGEWIATELPDA